MHELLPATLDSVATARRAVRRFALDLEVDVDGMVLAVSEAVANVVAHAYVEETDGVVELSAAASPLEVTVTVRDRGRGLGRGEGTPGAGYGLLIIRRLAQHVELADTRDGVALTMAFRRGGAWSAN
jgi:anti-sigma regulatory factor (Ser/Thr protein kinase)